MKTLDNSASCKVLTYISVALGALGLVFSPVFGAFFSLPGLIIGILGKKYERKAIVVLGIILNVISLLIAIITVIIMIVNVK